MLVNSNLAHWVEIYVELNEMQIKMSNEILIRNPLYDLLHINMNNYTYNNVLYVLLLTFVS